MLQLRKLRKEKNITMKQLGKIIGISESTVSLYETGKREPDYKILQSIADYFNVSIDYLLGNTDIKSKPPVNNCELVNEDDSLTEYLELLRTRPELKMMFQLAKGATKKDVELATKIIEAMLSDK